MGTSGAKSACRSERRQISVMTGSNEEPNASRIRNLSYFSSISASVRTRFSWKLCPRTKPSEAKKSETAIPFSESTSRILSAPFPMPYMTMGRGVSASRRQRFFSARRALSIIEDHAEGGVVVNTFCDKRAADRLWVDAVAGEEI